MKKHPHAIRKPNPQLVPLASRIRQLRIQNSHSQNNIAYTLDISQPAYAKKEAGFSRFKVKELKKLAQFLQIPIWELYFNESQQQAFAEFAKEKGYIQSVEYEKEIENYRNKIQLLEKEVEILTEMNRSLRNDKASLHKVLKFSGGG